MACTHRRDAYGKTAGRALKDAPSFDQALDKEEQFEPDI
jgi:hypothetical protein